MSKMSTTRSLSLSFQASCSMVSSKTHALPGTHSRVSLPQRKPQPSGTMSGRWVTSRTLVTPVWGGIRVPGLRRENIDAGVRPGWSGMGTPSSNPIVTGHFAAFSGTRSPDL